jgi:hypothetical protein
MEKARIENLRISALNVEGIAGLVSLFPEPEPLPAETRWLQLLKGTMNGLPLAEVVERYGVSIQAMERALRGCVKREEFKSASVESLVLHHLIHQRLGALCRLGDMCLGQPSEQQRRTEPVLQPAEGVAGLEAHGKAPAITATPVSLDFSSWKCHVLAALGDSKGSGQGALLRPPAFVASGDQTAGTRHQLTWT